eukprot:9475154-Pyramimonas_sp.AAC.1
MALVQLLTIFSMDAFVDLVRPTHLNPPVGVTLTLHMFADDLTLQVMSQQRNLLQMSADTVQLLCDTLRGLGLPV